MRWVVRHSQGVLPEVERIVFVAGHVEPVAAIAGPPEGEWGAAGTGRCSYYLCTTVY